MALAAKVIKRTKDSFEFRISKDNFESFCDSIGLYRREFLEALGSVDIHFIQMRAAAR